MVRTSLKSTFLLSVSLLGSALYADIANATTVSITPIATTGQAAGTTGETFTGFSSSASFPSIIEPVNVNDSGEASFFARITGPSFGSSNEGIFFSSSDGAISTIAVEGDGHFDRFINWHFIISFT